MAMVIISFLGIALCFFIIIKAAKNIKTEPELTPEYALILPEKSDPQRILSDKGDRYYLVDPSKSYCSCPDAKARNRFKKDDPRHLCKHLFTSMHPYSGHQKPVVREIILNQFPIYTNIFGLTIDEKPALIMYKQGEAWINYADETGFYGYSPAKKAWSYRKKPDQAEEIIYYINNNVLKHDPN